MEQIIQAAYVFAAQQMKAGKSRSQIQAALVEQGIEENAASSVVESLETMRSKAIKSAGLKTILIGLLCCFAGIGLTAWSFRDAAQNNGSVVIVWGLVLYGVVEIFRGLGQLAGNG